MTLPADNVRAMRAILDLLHQGDAAGARAARINEGLFVPRRYYGSK